MARARDISLLHNIQTGSGPHPASLQLVLVAVSLVVKQLGCEIATPFLSGAKFKNGGAVPPLHIYLHVMVVN